MGRVWVQEGLGFGVHFLKASQLMGRVWVQEGLGFGVHFLPVDARVVDEAGSLEALQRDLVQKGFGVLRPAYSSSPCSTNGLGVQGAK